MKALKNVVLPIIGIVVVVIGVFLLSKYADVKNYKSINNEQYKKVTKDTALVYVGKDENRDSILNDIANTYNKKIYKYEKDDQERIEVWKNGKVVYSYEFSDLNFDEKNKKSVETVDINKYLEEIVSDGYNFMIVGREGCHYCELYQESINELVNRLNIEVYYIDIATLSEDQQNTLWGTDQYFTTEEWGTPTTMLYKDGERIDMISGYVQIDELMNFMEKNYIVGFLKDSKVIK